MILSELDELNTQQVENLIFLYVAQKKVEIVKNFYDVLTPFISIMYKNS